MIKSLGNHRILTATNKDKIVLDFNPLLDSLINHPKLQESNPIKFLISHWNRVLGLPAYYCPQTGEYLTANETQIDIQCAEHFWVGFDRKDFPGVLPSSGLLYPNATMIKIPDETLIIHKAE
jgi:hypothetical protein